MKTISKTIALLLILNGISFSQSGWYQLNSGTTENLFSITFTDVNTGYTVGWNGTIRKTTDAGNSWFAQISPETGQIRSVCFTDINVGYISSSSAAIVYKTSNSGANWTTVNLSPGCNSQSVSLCIFFQNNNTGYVGRPCGRLAKTTNAGGSWETIITPVEENIRSVYFTSELTGYTAAASEITTSGHILKTTDAGNSWYGVLSYSDSAGFYCVHFADANTGIAVGGNGFSPNASYGIIFRTTDAGLSWTNLNFNSGNTSLLSSVRFVDQNQAYIVGRNFSPVTSSIILKTTNSGINWYFQSTGFYYLSGIYFTSLNTGYISGYQGTILKTTDGGGNFIGITPINEEMPASYILKQNYPNPFNPVTNINFSIPKNGFVKLIIFDIIGREISTLVNEELNPGKYEIEWNAANFPSGLYFYKIVTDNYIETKKMILVK